MLPFRRELEAARAWSVPRSIFLGRPMPAPGEPLWLPEDRWWALALLEAEAGICAGCGQILAESTALEGEDAYDSQGVPCHGCRAAARRTKSMQEQGADVSGMHLSVSRREQAWGSR